MEGAKLFFEHPEDSGKSPWRECKEMSSFFTAFVTILIDDYISDVCIGSVWMKVNELIIGFNRCVSLKVSASWS